MLHYTNHTDKELVKKSLDAIAEYGTWEDLDRIGFVRITDDEELIVPLVRTIAKVGRVGEDDYMLSSYIHATKHNLSNSTYIEILEAINKLSTEVKDEYPQIIRLLNKADTPDDPLLKTLVKTLARFGTHENVEDFNKFLRNYNHANDFINQGKTTPEVIKHAIQVIIDNIKDK